MTDDKIFLKLNTDIHTGSNASTALRNQAGDLKAQIELRLPDDLYNTRRPIKSVDLQTSKMRLSLGKLPIAFIPVNPTDVQIYKSSPDTGVPTKLWMCAWPFYVTGTGKVLPESYSVDVSSMSNYLMRYLEIPKNYEKLDYDFAIRTGYLPITRFETLTTALSQLMNYLLGYSSYTPGAYERTVNSSFEFGDDSVSFSYYPSNFPKYPLVPVGTPGAVLPGVVISDTYPMKTLFNVNQTWTKEGNVFQYTSELLSVRADQSMRAFSILVNRGLKELLHFLPWLEGIKYSDLLEGQKIPNFPATEDESQEVYVLDTQSAIYEAVQHPSYRIQQMGNNISSWGLRKNMQFRYTWKNLPTVNLSPISSIVLMLDGVAVNQQIMPINIKLPQGSSLTTSIPIIENYFPLFSGLKDMHDDLLLSRDAFTNTSVFNVPPEALTERNLRFRAGYITKDGQLFDLYIPAQGSFSVQLTLCIHFI